MVYAAFAALNSIHVATAGRAERSTMARGLIVSTSAVEPAGRRPDDGR